LTPLISPELEIISMGARCVTVTVTAGAGAVWPGETAASAPKKRTSSAARHRLLHIMFFAWCFINEAGA
jgi:hypothetical protein